MALAVAFVQKVNRLENGGSGPSQKELTSGRLAENSKFVTPVITGPGSNCLDLIKAGLTQTKVL